MAPDGGLLLLVCLSACADDETLIDQTGKELFIALEGGFYGIQGDDGKNHDPVNLPTAFQKHDLLCASRQGSERIK